MPEPTENSPNNPPEHVAIIMDGNGRWAVNRGLPRIEGHRRGVQNVRGIVECAGDIGIRYLTLYAFSVENWQRPDSEITALMNLLERFLHRELATLIEKRVRLSTIGRTDKLPHKVRLALDEVIQKTSHFSGQTLVLALNYGARDEVLDAVKSYATAVRKGEAEVEKLDWPIFARYLSTAGLPDPDLIIRTSGETRLSNFLLMQSAYAEMLFTPILWPDFGPEEFRSAMDFYWKRERRFGKTGAQVRHDPQEPALNP